MFERLCQRLIAATGTTRALLVVVILIVLEMIVGARARIDPYPFQFLSTLLNLLGFLMLFIIAIGQRGEVRNHDRVMNAITEQSIATRVHLKRHLDDTLAIHHRDLRDQIEDAATKKPRKTAAKPPARTRR